MRRIEMVLAVAAVMAMMLALAAGPALAQATPNDHNCPGATQSGNVAGRGGLPGSKVQPAPGFTDPVTGGPTFNGPVTRFVAQHPASTLGDLGIPPEDLTQDVLAKPTAPHLLGTGQFSALPVSANNPGVSTGAKGQEQSSAIGNCV
jgi:hypothetical protein